MHKSYQNLSVTVWLCYSRFRKYIIGYWRTSKYPRGHMHDKLLIRMWKDCLWNYVFPTLDRASHMAATSSKDEWRGKELGTRGGETVHMFIHHCRNTAQKQWDEILVLVLGGVA